MNVIDLSMPIGTDHFRWPAEHAVKGDFAAGDVFVVSSLRTSCHAFTHMDAPRHMVPDGATMEALDLNRVVGRCAVVDLSDLRPEQQVDADRLAAAGGHIEPGDIVLMRSCWDRQRDPNTAAFWTDAPYMSRDAAEWLLARDVTAVAFDFPQDYTIRLLLHGELRPVEEHVTHDVLLRHGVTLIEYVVNTAAVTAARTFLCALPLHLPGADGAPARVVAIDGLA